MQQRRFRPGDVLDDYCPRERRITDHAVVAMIDDRIKQTRCSVCDAEHEYKDGRVPPQRRKKPQAALFTQVLEGLQGRQAARLAHPDAESALDSQPDVADAGDTVPVDMHVHASGNGHPGHGTSSRGGNGRADVGPPPLPAPMSAPVVPAPVFQSQPDAEMGPLTDEGPVRRSLIRATLPRPEGQPLQPTRVLPEFTIRQPGNGRGGGGPRLGSRRALGHQPQGQGAPGPMRFGRGSHGGHGQGQGQGHGQGHLPHGGRNQGQNGGRPAGPRRGGKKR